MRCSRSTGGLVSLVVLLLLLFPSCQSSQTREVLNRAWRYYDARHVSCGDSRYDMYWAPFADSPCLRGYEIRGFEIRVEPHTLSDADRLNGVEWEGDIIISCSARRYYMCDHWLTAWENCTWQAEEWIHVRKVNGVWSEDWINDPERSRTDLTCDDVPR